MCPSKPHAARLSHHKQRKGGIDTACVDVPDGDAAGDSDHFSPAVDCVRARADWRSERDSRLRRQPDEVVRIVGINGACLIAPASIAETPVQWHIAGPPGEPGRQGPEGPVGPVGPMDPSGIAAAFSFTCGATELPANFQELQMLPNCSTLIDVADGQTLLVQIEIELQPPGPDPSSVFLAHLTIGHREPACRVHRRRPCPSGPPLGFPGIHNRPHSIQGLLAELASGSHEIGLAGLGYPEPGASLPIFHLVRIMVLVLNPGESP